MRVVDQLATERSSGYTQLRRDVRRVRLILARVMQNTLLGRPALYSITGTQREIAQRSLRAYDPALADEHNYPASTPTAYLAEE